MTYFPSPDDERIENVPPKSYAWVNVYPRGDGNIGAGRTVFHSRQAADDDADIERIGCVKVELAARYDE